MGTNDLQDHYNCATLSTADSKIRDAVCDDITTVKGFVCSKRHKTEASCTGCINPVDKTMLTMVTTSPSCPTVRYRSDILGTDLGAALANSRQPDCSTQCLANSLCKGWVYENESCQLKSDIVGFVPHRRKESAVCSSGMQCLPRFCKEIRRDCTSPAPALPAGVTQDQCEDMPYHQQVAWQAPAVVLGWERQGDWGNP